MSHPGAPRHGLLIWGGYPLSVWLGLLARNRFAVHPMFRRGAVKATLLSAVSSLLGLFQEIRYGRAIRRTAIREAPIFILGHWRCGTTYLFDLLSRDERLAYADTYDCLFPGHFLISRDFVTRRVPLEGTRGVDGVPLGWQQPREDEFALCAMGASSPYLTAAFPNRPPQNPNYLDLRDLSPRERHAWTCTFRRFLQAITLKKGKRLLLKSPPHTARLPVLTRLFPDARFIHIVRNPFAVIPSTLGVWRAAFEGFGLQVPTHAGVEDFVFANFRRLYQCLEEDRSLVPSSHFHELRYEDLVADPIAQAQAIYERLDLGDFEQRRLALESYLASLGNYAPSSHKVSPELRARIERECGDVLRRYGYGAS
jgi:hypothetical protein